MSSCKKPKRPLTPYNLFYRFKRGRILQAFKDGDDNRDDVVMKLIAAAPGLEDLTPSQLRAISPKDAYTISRGVIREELQGNLLPFEGKRSHRKTHGAMSFIEMGQMMCDQWKLVDSSIKAIFEELADEGKQMYREQTSIAKQEWRDSTGAVTSSPPALLPLSIAIASSPSPASYSNDSPLHSFDGNHTSNWSTYSPSSSKQDINIVSPTPSPRVYSPHDSQDYELKSNTENHQDFEDQDDFCDFIDKNVHLVDIDEEDSLDFDDDIFTTSSSLRDVIDDDAIIQHCALPF